VSRRDWLLLSVLAALWGASYLFIKIGLRDLSPAMVVFVRTALAALVLLPFAVRLGTLGPLRGRLALVSGLAALQVAGPFALITAGEQWIASSMAGILVASAPIFTAILAIWVDQSERARGWSVVGIAVGIVGVALLLGVDLSGDALALVGGLMVLLAGLGYALGGFVVKRGFAGLPPIGLVTVTMTASAAMLLPFAAATAPDHVPGLDASLSVLTLGVAGTGISFVIFYTLIANVGPARASIVAYLAPGFAVAYGAVFLDERITVATIAGLALIVGGSWLAAEGRLPGRGRVAAPEAAAAATEPALDARRAA
jgi:drug/metabolite transporter (DMT)-like permease